MINWIGMQFMTTINGYAAGVVAYMMAWLTPLALTCLTIGFALRGYATLRGATSEPLPEIAWEGFCKLLIVAFATNAAIYHEWIIDVQNGLTLQVAQQFAPPGSPMRTAANPWAMIEAFNDRASELTAMTVTEGVFSSQFWVALLAVLFFSCGNALMIVAAMLVCAVTGSFNAFLLGVGPLFIMFLLVGQVGRQWFVNWLGTLLGMAVLTWLVFLILGFSMSLTEKVVDTIVPHLGDVNVLTQSVVYMAMCFTWAVMLWVAPSFVNGLTGGGAAQMGTQLLTQVMMAMRMGGGSGGSGTPAAGGNSAAGGRGWAHRAGQAVGAMSGAAPAFQALAARGRAR
jgi:type IV secretion system protein VirB6